MSIPWIPILSAGAGLLGSLFGDNKNTNQSENSATSTTEAQTNKTSLDATTTQNTTQTQQSNQASNQASTQDVNGLTTEQQTGALTRLDATTLDLLTQAVQKGLGSDNDLQVLRQRMSELSGNTPAFDSEGYINSIMSSARNDVAGQVESATGSVQGRVGANGRSNSAAALLEAKIKNQGAATLAGIQGDAQAKAEELSRARQESTTGQITNLAAQTDAGSANLLNALLSAKESQTSVGTTAQNQNTVGSTSGTTVGNTATQNQVTENQSQDQVQAVASTSASRTKGNIKQNSSELNWGDLFTNLGKALGSQF